MFVTVLYVYFQKMSNLFNLITKYNLNGKAALNGQKSSRKNNKNQEKIFEKNSKQVVFVSLKKFNCEK